MRVWPRLVKIKGLNRIDAISGPLFAATMWWEYRALARRQQRRFDDLDGANEATLSGTHLPADPLVPVGYERRDTVASLSLLVGSVVVNLASAGVIGKVHQAVFRRRLLNLGASKAAMPLAMVAWDLAYYWDHRLMHEVRLLWANHVAHHSSRRYNLSTALRQPWAAPLTAYAFLPLPLLGFNFTQTRIAGQLNLLYQYWIHTEAIDRLPRLAERVLNTPSHHRVHHGANRQYIDKNYGGILIVWDRLFGTFEPELRKLKYGLTKNVSTYNPLRLAYQEFVDIAGDMRRGPGWRATSTAVFGPPVSAA